MAANLFVGLLPGSILRALRLRLWRQLQQLLDLLTPNFKIGRIWQAEEFVGVNSEAIVTRFAKSFGGIPLVREAHADFKKRVPNAIGLIRTGDTTQYGNMILESA